MTQPLTEISARSFLGVKAADKQIDLVCRLSKKMGAVTSRRSKGHFGLHKGSLNPLGTELFFLRIILILSFRQMQDLGDEKLRKI